VNYSIRFSNKSRTAQSTWFKSLCFDKSKHQKPLHHMVYVYIRPTTVEFKNLTNPTDIFFYLGVLLSLFHRVDHDPPPNSEHSKQCDRIEIEGGEKSIKHLSHDDLQRVLPCVAPTDRVRRVGVQPLLDAMFVEHVSASRQLPRRRAIVPDRAQADRALTIAATSGVHTSRLGGRQLTMLALELRDGDG
jgi:hypothetical protein